MSKTEYYVEDKALKEMMKRKISFVLFRPNNEEASLIVQQTEQIKTYHSLNEISNREGFLFAPFQTTDKQPIVLIKSDEIIKGNNINKILRDNIYKDASDNTEETLESDIIFEGNKESYSDTFHHFINLIRDNRYKKLVLSRSEETTFRFSQLAPYSLFERACSLYPNAYVYALYTPISGFWLGATPELLLSKQGTKGRTMSLAGTMEFKENISINDWSEKNILEQQLVTKYIESQLQGLNIVPETSRQKIQKAGELAHLATEISFNCNNRSLGELLETIYPTPAICGLPKVKAKKEIIENETNDRSYYSGIVGYTNATSESLLYVNLRCLSYNNDILRLYAGGGLLENSILEDEWKETEKKLKTMQKLFS